MHNSSTNPFRTFSLALNLLGTCCSGQPRNCHYLISSNKVIPLVDLTNLVLSQDLSKQQCAAAAAAATAMQDQEVQHPPSDNSAAQSQCGPLLHLLASMISTLASVPSTEHTDILAQQVTDTIRCGWREGGREEGLIRCDRREGGALSSVMRNHNL